MPRPRSDIEPRVISAARQRFLQEGVDGASLRGIAQDAETSIGMIYYYFPSKDDLFLAVVEDVYARVLDDIASIVQTDAPFGDHLMQLYQRIAGLSDEEFVVFRIVIREALVSSARLEKLAARFARGHFPLVALSLQRAIDQGHVGARYPIPLLIAFIAGGGVMPQLVRRLLVERMPALAALFPTGPKLAEALHDLVLHGISSPSPPDQ